MSETESNDEAEYVSNEQLVNDVVPAVEEGDVLVVEASRKVNRMTGERETRTFEVTVDRAEINEYDTHTGCTLTTADENTYSTDHGRIEGPTVNTTGDFPAYLYTGTTNMKSRQDRQGRVESITLKRSLA